MHKLHHDQVYKIQIEGIGLSKIYAHIQKLYTVLNYTEMIKERLTNSVKPYLLAL